MTTGQVYPEKDVRVPTQPRRARHYGERRKKAARRGERTIDINNHRKSNILFCGTGIEDGKRIIVTRGSCGEYFCSKMGGSIKKGTPCVSCPLQ
ncbi:MAG: hypothetical protein PHH16_03310 [Candidatus Gracilibacteria bacterium]|nr:hypothetical protein [Candidatus Gracilibacteria bacterium]